MYVTISYSASARYLTAVDPCAYCLGLSLPSLAAERGSGTGGGLQLIRVPKGLSSPPGGGGFLADI